MAAAVNTAWVQPVYETGGLDHLGVRAPCIHIYGGLLPGINNVTDRLRYYSFYTWVIWSLENQGHRSLDDATRQRIRRADCLFTAIANAHAQSAEENRERHTAAAVGNLTLGPAVASLGENETLQFSKHATDDEVADRYFKNKFGGLGQYYLGSLRDVLLLDGDGQSGIRFTKERGRPLAEAFNSTVDGERFWSCIDKDSATLDDLRSMATFCPCGLSQGSEEQSRLADILLGRDDFVVPAGKMRRDTLRLYLHLASSLDAAGLPFDVDHFRAAVYSGSLGNGVDWRLPQDLDGVRERWAVYATNEILSLGLQGIFYGLLSSRLEKQHEVRVETAHELAQWFLESDTGDKVLQAFENDSVAAELASIQDTLPTLDSWHDDSHEIALASAISNLGDEDISDDVVIDIVQHSVRALITLAARFDGSEDPYSNVTFPPGYFEFYPLNLRSFLSHMKNGWAKKQFADWLVEVMADWTVNAHIRVALRKLRSQSKATFQVRPSDDGLVVTGVPTPEFSSPRFRQGRQVLIDLGAMTIDDNERCALTDLGKTLLETNNG